MKEKKIEDKETIDHVKRKKIKKKKKERETGENLEQWTVC